MGAGLGEWTKADEIGTEAAAALELARAGKRREFWISPQHRSLGGAGAFLMLALAIFVIMHLASIALSMSAVSFLERAGAGEIADVYSEAIALESNANTLMITSIGALVLCAIAYSVFVYTAAWNIDQSHASGCEFTPGWAAGWSFVPFANLFMPYKVMKQIWIASHDPARGAAVAPGFLVLWWLSYIIGNLVSNITDRIMQTLATPEQIISMTWWSVGASILSIGSATVLFVIVRRIIAAQAAWASIPAAPPHAAHDPNAPLF